MSKVIRYSKPQGKSTRAGMRKSELTGKQLSSRPARIYKGCELRSTGAGFHHIFMRGTMLWAGVRTVRECHDLIDKHEDLIAMAAAL